MAAKSDHTGMRWWAVAGLGLCAAVGWNSTRFIGADRNIYIRMDERLDAIPNPVVLRMASMGHRNTAANVRFISSYTYLQYLFETGEEPEPAALYRLFRALTGTDPYFEPYYYYSALIYGGILDDQLTELRILARGVYERPNSPQMWRNFVTNILVDYDLERRNSSQVDALLGVWSEAMADAGYYEEVGLLDRWREVMARRSQIDMGEVSYWTDQAASNEQGPQAEATLNALRSVITDRILDIVNGLPNETPLLNAILLSEAGYTEELNPAYDPFGYRWLTIGGQPASEGQRLQNLVHRARHHFDRGITNRSALNTVLMKDGFTPEECRFVQIELSGRRLAVTVPDPHQQPWTLVQAREWSARLEAHLLEQQRNDPRL